MKTNLIRDAIETLLQETYEGPPDPKTTWIASNVADSGILSTVKHLTPEQAWAKPHGLKHSVAEHLAHLNFSIDVAMKYARGEEPGADWTESWDVGDIPDEARWHAMQRQLRESHLRMRMWVHADEPFEKKEALTGFLACVAHAAYHLGQIRQAAELARQAVPADDAAVVRTNLP